MTIHVNIGEAKTRLSELLAALREGEKVYIMRSGEIEAELVPAGEARDAARKRIADRRRAAFGMYAEKYRHLIGTDALTVPDAMTDEELDKRFERKFGASPS